MKIIYLLDFEKVKQTVNTPTIIDSLAKRVIINMAIVVGLMRK
jgi:hypothetical protein